jgi:hypothetical protein
MTIKVIKDAYYVNEDVSGLGLIDHNTFESSYTHTLVVGDIWKKVPTTDGYELFECISGRYEGEDNDGFWEYKNHEGYFEVI